MVVDETDKIDEADNADFAYALPYPYGDGSYRVKPVSISEHSNLTDIISTIQQYKDSKNNIFKGVMAVVSYREGIQKILFDVDGELHLRNLFYDEGARWEVDNKKLHGLRMWLDEHCSTHRSTYDEAKIIIDICVQYQLIKRMSRDEFCVMKVTEELVDSDDRYF